MADRLHLSARHRRVLEALLRTHLPDVEVWAYGSRVNGRSHDGSDLDLVLRGPGLKEIPGDQLADFEEAVRESMIPFLVEARDWARLPERFHREIERGYVVVLGSAVDDHLCSQWPTAPIQDISERVAMGPFGSSIKVETFVPHGVPIISGQHLHGARVDDSPGYNFITEGHARRLSNAYVERGDIVFTHAGNIGQVAYVPDNSRYERYIISQRQFCLRCDRRKAMPEFIAYYFRSPEGRHKLLANASQVGVPSIAQPVTYLRTIQVRLPPIEEQRAIAHILGTLDDKIELNRRMNETLEAMARAIFKDWFFDFGPTRAKAEGRAPYLAAELWDLFPDALDDKGKPVGWDQGTLADIAESPRRSINPADVSENTPYIGLEHMPRRSIALSDWEGAGKVKSNKTQFKRGEILFGKLRPYFHKVGLAPLDGICSTDIVVVVPRTQEWEEFALACLSSDEFVDYTDRTSTGTKMPRTIWKTMAQYRMCLPSAQVVCAFQGVVRPLLDRLGADIHETSMLARTRDLLLPKLMSGEIRFRDAEKSLEAVA